MEQPVSTDTRLMKNTNPFLMKNAIRKLTKHIGFVHEQVLKVARQPGWQEMWNDIEPVSYIRNKSVERLLKLIKSPYDKSKIECLNDACKLFPAVKIVDDDNGNLLFYMISEETLQRYVGVAHTHTSN